MVKSPYSSQTKVSAQNGESLEGNTTVPNGRINPRTGNLITSNTESFVGADGNINASSKREAMQALEVMQAQAAAGRLKTPSPFAHLSGDQRKNLIEQVKAAYNDSDPRAFEVVGEVVGEKIYVTLGREAFARKCLMQKELAQGETPRMTVRDKDVVSYFSVEAPNVIASQVRQRFVYPPLFDIACAIEITNKEIAQAPGDLLDDKYQDGLEQILRKEDQTFLNLLETAAAFKNDVFYFNTLTPSVFSEMQIQVQSWGIPVHAALVSFDLWTDIRTDPEFASYFDPVTKLELIQTGSIGKFMGVDLITDAYRYQTLRVLGDGQIYMLGAPETLGGMMTLAGLQTRETNQYANKRNARGWFMAETIAMTVVNSLASCHGIRQ